MNNIKTFFLALLFLFVVGCDEKEPAKTTTEPTVVPTISSTVEPTSPPAKNSSSDTTSSVFQEGKDYTVLATVMPTRDSTKIEVIEFFWYGCPHCFELEPRLEAWVAKLPSNIDFWRSPVIWGPVRENHAQVYYTAEALGVLDKAHQAFFEVVQAGQIAKKDNVYTTPAEAKAFFISQGVTEDKFDQTFSSFTVMSKIKLADARGRSYAIQGVPTLVVNGKYAVQGSMPHSLKVVDYLIAREKK